MAQKFPTATRQDHERFCITEGWVERKRATGKRGTHHVNYELSLADGRILFTRISHPVDRSTYGASLWAHILRDQLVVTNSEFWACVNDSILPTRDAGTLPESSIPLSVVTTLIQEVGLPESEVRQMTKSDAFARLAEFYSQPQ